DIADRAHLLLERERDAAEEQQVMAAVELDEMLTLRGAELLAKVDVHLGPDMGRDGRVFQPGGCAHVVSNPPARLIAGYYDDDVHRLQGDVRPASCRPAGGRRRAPHQEDRGPGAPDA